MFIFYHFLSNGIIRNGRFTGGTQQDSHEALRQILDALRMEEIDVSLHFNGRCIYNLWKPQREHFSSDFVLDR